MLVKMDVEMIEKLNEIKENGTIYFKKRALVTDKFDLCFYQIVSDYLNYFEHEHTAKAEQYLDLLSGWYYSLMRLKKEDKEGADTKEHFKVFNNSYQKHTIAFTEEQKLTVLYRFPWHLRAMLLASSGKPFVSEFIHNVAEMNDIKNLDFTDISYQAITSYDKWSLKVIQNEISDNNEEKLSYQLEENLSYLIDGFENLKDIVELGVDQVSEKNEHGLYLVLKLLKMKKEEQIDFNTFEYMMLSISNMCVWHFEAKYVKPIWYIKKGLFQHLKSVQEKLRKPN